MEPETMVVKKKMPTLFKTSFDQGRKNYTTYKNFRNPCLKNDLIQMSSGILSSKEIQS